MHHCRIKNGKTGRCRVRKNADGKNTPVNYGLVTSVALDPIEKKPLVSFHPGSKILSVGSFGCNLNCPFCQNASIAAASVENAVTEFYSPVKLAELAEKTKKHGNIGVAYTYNEPMIGYEYIRDTAVEIKRRGMVNVVVTNGSVTPAALNAVLPYVDAYNIDLKAFTASFYEKVGGDIKTVLKFIEIAAKNAHVELTTLIIPDENDSPAEIQELSAWVASVNRGIPLHITRFFPCGKMSDKTPTDIRVMRRLAGIARQNLDTVILGNI